MQTQLKVLIADDHPVVRAGLVAMLRRHRIDVVSEAVDGAQAVEQFATSKPDIVLLDIRMPRHDGFWALERIREKAPRQPVIMLTTFPNRDYIAQSVLLGANEYLLKDSPELAFDVD